MMKYPGMERIFKGLIVIVVMTGATVSHPVIAKNKQAPHRYCHTEDRFGNPVFSDHPTESHEPRHRCQKSLREIQTTRFKKIQSAITPGKPSNNQGRRKSRDTSNHLPGRSKSQPFCQLSKQKIQELETLLRRKTDAKAFDRIKSQLQRLRWKRVKRC